MIGLHLNPNMTVVAIGILFLKFFSFVSMECVVTSEEFDFSLVELTKLLLKKEK